MALYSYEAFSKDGKRVTGSLDAGSVAAAKESLAKMGLFPVTITLATEGTAAKGSFFSRLFAPRVTLKDKIFFTKQLAVLLKAGVPMLDALELLIEQSEKGLRSIVIELKDGVKEGQSLADGLSKFPKVFDTTYIQLVRAGEASGNLERILERLTSYLEQSQELRKQVKKALMMPVIQLVMVVFVVIALLVLVIPKIAEVFEGQGIELPLPTRMMMGFTNFVLDHFIMLLVIIVLSVVLFFWWKSTARGARAWDAFILKVPLVGDFARTSAVVQFSRTLGMLQEGGVNLAESLGIVTKIVDNRVLVDTLNEARENIIKQGKIADYLKQTKLFPPLAIYLISTGEKSGQLDTMLLTVAQTYEVELQEKADVFAASLKAAMPLVMGLIVGFVVYAIAKPIMGLSEAAEKSSKIGGI